MQKSQVGTVICGQLHLRHIIRTTPTSTSVTTHRICGEQEHVLPVMMLSDVMMWRCDSEDYISLGQVSRRVSGSPARFSGTSAELSTETNAVEAP